MDVATSAGREARARIAEAPGDTLVALDYDGVLAPIVPRPEDAVPLPEVVDVLAQLAQRVRRVAVITGRSAAGAVELGELDRIPGLVVLGHYGLERWHSGQLTTPPENPAIERLRGLLGAIVAAAPSGTTLEDKGHSLAVHTRRTDDPAAVLEALRAPVQAAADAAGMELMPGRLVLEVRPPGSDKGGALRSVVAEVGPAVVVYAGDDLGDLPAVAVLHELRGQGLASLVICSDSPETPAALRDAADLVVDGPRGVLEALRSLFLG